MKTTETRVIQIIRSIKDIKYPITKDMDLINDLFLDSLDMLMMINAIESEFSYEVDMGEVEKIKTVGDIIGILETETSKTGIHERH